MQRRTTARAVGALFITASVAGVLSNAFLDGQRDPDSLVTAAANSGMAALGSLAIVVMLIAVALIPAVLFPVLRRHDEALALGYVVARTVEAVCVLPAAITPLMLVALSSEYTGAGSPDAAIFGTLRELLLGFEAWGNPIMTIVFCVGALILNTALYRSGLVPRVLSVWGFTGAAVYLVGGVLALFGLLVPTSPLLIALTVPLGVNEMALAVWLLVKGFNPTSAAAAEVVAADRVKAG